MPSFQGFSEIAFCRFVSGFGLSPTGVRVLVAGKSQVRCNGIHCPFAEGSSQAVWEFYFISRRIKVEPGLNRVILR